MDDIVSAMLIYIYIYITTEYQPEYSIFIVIFYMIGDFSYNL